MGFLDIVRVLYIAAWLGVLAYTTSGVYALAFGRPRSGDPARLVVAGFSILQIMFASRAQWFPNNDILWAGLYVLGAIWAGYTVLAAKAYGRGN